MVIFLDHEDKRNDFLDKIFLHPVLGLLSLALMMFIVFQAVFAWAAPFMDGIEEFIVVALVCGLFLWHLRSAMVAIVSLPLGILSAFLLMYYQGLNANIMSLGGIAIAIGAMVDAAVVMVENAHKHIEAWQHEHPDQVLKTHERWDIITHSASEVGPALFFCLLIITLSFIPIFTLQAQEGRLFSP